MKRICFGAAFVFAAISVARADSVLDIGPVRQETPVWCWVAVSEMVMRHYQVANVNPGGDYQCGFIGALAYGTNAQVCNLNCSVCTVPAGSAQVLVNAINEYPKRVAAGTLSEQPRLSASRTGVVSFSAIKTEIDNDRPMIIGITPAGHPIPGVSQHVVVIRGYRERPAGNEVLINDPYPYEAAQSPNPYITSANATPREPLAYWVRFDALVPALAWQDTLFIRKVGTYAPPSPAPAAALPHFCCTVFGKSGPWPNPGPAGVPVYTGGACTVPGPYGPVVGQACY
jgi:hypothetical protein